MDIVEISNLTTSRELEFSLGWEPSLVPVFQLELCIPLVLVGRTRDKGPSSLKK
jgi:hypothetical protein